MSARVQHIERGIRRNVPSGLFFAVIGRTKDGFPVQFFKRGLPDLEAARSALADLEAKHPKRPPSGPKRSTRILA